MTKNAHQEQIGHLFPDERNTDVSALRKVQLIQLRILKLIDYICKSNNITYWLDGGTLLGAVRHQGFIPWDDDIDIVMPRCDYERFLSIAKESLPKDLEIDIYTSSKNKDHYIPCKIVDKFSEIQETTDNLKDIGRGIFIDITPLDYFNSKFPFKNIDVLLKKIHRTLIKISNKSSEDKFKAHYAVHRLLKLLAPVITPETPISLFKKALDWKLKKAKNANLNSEIIGYGFDSYWIRLFNVSHVFPLKSIKFEDSYFPSPANPREILKIFYGPDYMTTPKKENRTNVHIKKAIIDKRKNIAGEYISYLEHDKLSTINISDNS